MANVSDRIPAKSTTGATRIRRIEAPISLLLVQANRLKRTGLVKLLATVSNIRVIGHYSRLGDVEEVALRRPSVVLLVELNEEICGELSTMRNQWASLPLVLLGTSDAYADMLDAVDWSADLYLPKLASLGDICDALHMVARSGRPDGARALLLSARSRGCRHLASVRGEADLSELTVRQLQVVRAVAQGLSNENIADELGIRPQTVRNHIHAVLQRLSLTSRAQLASLARTQRLVRKCQPQ